MNGPLLAQRLPRGCCCCISSELGSSPATASFGEGLSPATSMGINGEEQSKRLTKKTSMNTRTTWHYTTQMKCVIVCLRSRCLCFMSKDHKDVSHTWCTLTATATDIIRRTSSQFSFDNLLWACEIEIQIKNEYIWR